MSASRLKPATKRHNANISMAYGCEKDNNTYCYRLTNGHKHLHRIILGYGWENTPFDVTKLSCYEKGEESMTGKTGYHKQWLPWNELMPQVEQMLAEGKGVPEIAQRLGIKKDTLWKRMNLNKKAQTSEPTGGQPDPAQSEASAKDIVPQGEMNESIRCVETIDECEMCGEKSGSGPRLRKYVTPELKEVCYECYVKFMKDYVPAVNYAPTDNDYNEREAGTQRTTLTRAQYDAMEMNDDRMSALAIFCENQAVEQLRQDWAVDIFKHSRLSRERKLELIGHLLDWRARA